jgi:peroxidase
MNEENFVYLCKNNSRKREELAPGDKFVRIAFSEASVEVDNAINQTVASLFQPLGNNTTSSSRDYGDLFRIVRFPSGPARELARASEIYERTLVNIRKHINGGSNITANISTNFNYDDILSTEYLELLAQLSDCAAHRVTPNCTDMWLVFK